MLDWGSTLEERLAALPGDDLAPDARTVATRALTIRAWYGALGPAGVGVIPADGSRTPVPVGPSYAEGNLQGFGFSPDGTKVFLVRRWSRATSDWHAHRATQRWSRSSRTPDT
jgi:hypothetical protein